MYQGHLREYYKILLIATAGDTRGSRTATYIKYVFFLKVRPKISKTYFSRGDTPFKLCPATIAPPRWLTPTASCKHFAARSVSFQEIDEVPAYIFAYMVDMHESSSSARTLCYLVRIRTRLVTEYLLHSYHYVRNLAV